MVDKKAKFVLSLQGKEYAGCMEHWTLIADEIVGLVENKHYHVLSKFKIKGDVVVGIDRYYTLGKKVTHKLILGIISCPAKGKYGLKEYG